jgi:AcrR family transcriptional regulator
MIEQEALEGQCKADTRSLIESLLDDSLSLISSFDTLLRSGTFTPLKHLRDPIIKSLRDLSELVYAVDKPLNINDSSQGLGGMRNDLAASSIEALSNRLKELELNPSDSWKTARAFSKGAWSCLKLINRSARKLTKGALRTSSDRARAKRLAIIVPSLLALAILISLALPNAYKSWRFSKLNPTATRRIEDLKSLEKALISFGAERGYYPKTDGRWDGLYSDFGRSDPNWIPELTPKYIASLPRDPRGHTKGDEQYLYWSDGKDFKVIAHNVPDAISVKDALPEMYDTARPGRSIGVWSAGAALK